MDIAARNADIGQFSVTELRKLAQTCVVSLPDLEEADDCDNHGSSFANVPESTILDP
jgi:hypothetical protein